MIKLDWTRISKSEYVTEWAAHTPAGSYFLKEVFVVDKQRTHYVAEFQGKGKFEKTNTYVGNRNIAMREVLKDIDTHRAKMEEGGWK